MSKPDETKGVADQISNFSAKDVIDKIFHTIREQTHKISDKLAEKAAESEDFIEHSIHDDSETHQSEQHQSHPIQESTTRPKEPTSDRYESLKEEAKRFSKISDMPRDFLYDEFSEVEDMSLEKYFKEGSSVFIDMDKVKAKDPDLYNYLKTREDRMMEKFKDLLEEKSQIEMEALQKLEGKESKTEGITDKISHAVHDATEKAKNIVVIGTVAEKTGETVQKAKQKLHDVKEGVTDAAVYVKDKTLEKATNIQDKVAEKFHDTTTGIAGAIGKGLVMASGAVGNAVDTVSEVGHTVKDKVVEVKDKLEEKIGIVKEKTKEKANEAMSEGAHEIGKTEENPLIMEAKVPLKKPEESIKHERHHERHGLIETIKEKGKETLEKSKEAEKEFVEGFKEAIHPHHHKEETHKAGKPFEGKQEIHERPVFVRGIYEERELTHAEAEKLVKDIQKYLEDDFQTFQSPMFEMLATGEKVVPEKEFARLPLGKNEIKDRKTIDEALTSTYGDEEVSKFREEQRKKLEEQPHNLKERLKGYGITGKESAEKFVEQMKDLKEKSKEKYQDFKDNVGQRIEKIEKKGKEMKETIKEDEEKVKGILERGKDKIVSGYETAKEKGKNVLESGKTKLADEFSEIKEGTVERYESAKEKVGEMIGHGKEKMQPVKDKLDEKVIEPAREKLDDLKDRAERKYDQMKEKAENEAKDLKKDADQARVGSEPGLGMKIIGATAQTLGAVTEKVKEKGEDIIEGVKETGSNIIEKGKSLFVSEHANLPEEKEREIKGDRQPGSEEGWLDKASQKLQEISPFKTETEKQYEDTLRNPEKYDQEHETLARTDTVPNLETQKKVVNVVPVPIERADRVPSLFRADTPGTSIAREAQNYQNRGEGVVKTVEPTAEELLRTERERVQRDFIRGDEEKAKGLLSRGKDAIVGGYETVKDKVESVIGTVEDKAENVYEGAKEKIAGGAEMTKDKTEGFVEKAKEKLEGGYEAVKEKVGDIIEKVEDKVGNIYEGAKEKAGDLIDTGKEKVHAGYEASKDKISSGYDSVKNAASGLVGKGKEKIGDIVEGGKEKFESGKEMIKDGYEGMKEKAVDVTQAGNEKLEKGYEATKEKISDTEKSLQRSHPEDKESWLDKASHKLQEISPFKTETEKQYDDSLRHPEKYEQKHEILNKTDTVPILEAEKKVVNVVPVPIERADRVPSLFRADTPATSIAREAQNYQNRGEGVVKTVEPTAEELLRTERERVQRDFIRGEEEKAKGLLSRGKDAIVGGYETVKDKVGSVIGTVEHKAEDIYEGAKEKAGDLIGRSKDKVQEGVDTSKEKLNEGYNAAKSKAGELIEKGKEKVDEAKSQVELNKTEEDHAKGLLTRGKDAIVGGYETVKEKVGSVIGTVEHKAEDIYEGAKEKAGDLLGIGKDKVQEGVDTSKEKLNEGYDATKSKAGELVEKGKEKVEEGREKMREGYESAMKKTGDVSEKGKEKLREGYVASKEKISQGYEAAKDKVGEFVEKGKEKIEPLEDKAIDMKDKAMEKGRDLKERAVETGKEIKDQAKDKIAEGKQTVNEKSDQAADKGKGLIEAIKEKGSEIIEKGKEIMGKTKADQEKEDLKGQEQERQKHAAEIAKNQVDQKIESKKREAVEKLGGEKEVKEHHHPGMIEMLATKDPDQLTIEDITNIKSLTEQRYEQALKDMKDKNLFEPEVPKTKSWTPFERAEPVAPVMKADSPSTNLGQEAKNYSPKGILGSAKDTITEIYHRARESLGLINVTPRQEKPKDDPFKNYGSEKRQELDVKRQVSPGRDDLQERFEKRREVSEEEKRKARAVVEKLKEDKFDERPTRDWSEYFEGGGFE